MKSRRFLLVTKALGSASLLLACKKESMVQPLPGNPKGSHYDETSAQDAGTPKAEPLPGNPKGSSYDEGLAPSAKAAPIPPPSVVATTTQKIRPPANPKGSHYDAGSPLAPPTKP